MIKEYQKRAVTKYRKNHYDTITLTMEKGKRDIIKQYAQKKELSVNGFINLAIDRQIELENQLQNGNEE